MGDVVDPGTDPLARAEDALVAHQRFDNRSCLCGWAELGKSHPRHVAGVLAAAGLLRDQPAETWTEYVAFCGGEDPANAAWVLPPYSEQHDAEEDTQWLQGGKVSMRTVSAGPWRPIEATDG